MSLQLLQRLNSRVKTSNYHEIERTRNAINYNKLLVFGHRSLIKNIKQTAVITILKTCIL